MLLTGDIPQRQTKSGNEETGTTVTLKLKVFGKTKPHKIASPAIFRCPEIKSVCCVFLKMLISLITNTEMCQISQMIASGCFGK